MTLLHRHRSLPLAFLLAVALLITAATVEGGNCAGESLSFSCPNCGGEEVKDCADCDGYTFTDYNYGLCYNRKLFNTHADNGNSDNHYPFLWTDIVGSVVWFFTAGVATACGVGGGGIYVPLGILLLRFPPKASSGLSQASIFGATVGGILVNIVRRYPDVYIRDTKGIPSTEHPGKIVPYEKGKGPIEIQEDRQRYLDGGDGKRKFYTRPVIDYNMALFLAPMEMAGALLGVIIQRVFPNWLYLCFAAVVLGFTAYKTIVKFFASYKKDKAAKEERIELTRRESQRILESQKRASQTRSEPCVEDYGVNRDGGNDEDDFQDNYEDDDPKVLEQRRKFLEEDSRQYPFEKISYLILLWIGLTVLTFLKGGKGVDSVIGITCQSPIYYELVATQFIWTFGFATVFGWRNVKITKERAAVNYPFNETDVLWDLQKLRFFSFWTFVAGVVAGLIGIGGGMILGPLMIVNGVNPIVSTATTATMILLTSSSVAIMFVMSGLVPWQYAVYFFSVCLLGAYIGKTFIDGYVKKHQMGSILVGLLGCIIALATIGCVITLFMNLAKVNWCVDGFKPFCSVISHETGCPTRLLSSLSAEEIFPY